jgi:hypothetical protein
MREEITIAPRKSEESPNNSNNKYIGRKGGRE